MKDIVRVGLIGFDHVHADMRAKALGESEFVKIVAVSDADEGRGLEAQAKYGGDYHQDYLELLDRDDVDFVFIHSETVLHNQMVLDAAARGKDLFCEKPIATTLDDAHAMVAAVEAAGVRHTIGFNSRLIPEAERAKAIIDSGVLGRIATVRSYLGSAGPAELGCPPHMVEWITDQERAGGGALIDEGVHALDLMRWYLGEIDTVFTRIASIDKTDLNVEDNAITLLTFASGALGELNTSWTTSIDVGMKNTVEFYGSQGTMIVELTSKSPRVRLYAEGAATDVSLAGWIEPQIKPDSSQPHDYDSWPTHAIHFKREIDDLVHRIRTGEPFLVTLEDGLRIAEVTTAAYSSARSNAPESVARPSHN
ncbi:Gfo/Idh/MocA family oxidoreductase [soil metagenome]